MVRAVRARAALHCGGVASSWWSTVRVGQGFALGLSVAVTAPDVQLVPAKAEAGLADETTSLAAPMIVGKFVRVCCFRCCSACGSLLARTFYS